MNQPAVVLIRRYTDADLDAVITVFLRSIREIAARDYSSAQIDAWAQVDRAAWKIRRASRPTWVGVYDNEIVGFTDLEPDGHLDMMFVHPAHQGRGIATSLLGQVESAARVQDLSEIFTEASLTARPFFEKRGFTTTLAQEVVIRGQSLRNFRMRKFLTTT